VIQFNAILEKCYKELDCELSSGIAYAQYTIIEEQGLFKVVDNARIVGSTKTIKEARELCDTINSGC
jgi:hypothetical protein